MTKQEKLLAAQLLKEASEEFSNHICNDHNLERSGMSTEERQNLIRKMYENNGDPENLDPNSEYKFFYDWWLMSYLSEQLKKEAQSM